MGCHALLQGILSTQGLNPHLLHWQVDSSPLRHPGRPRSPSTGTCRLVSRGTALTEAKARGFQNGVGHWSTSSVHVVEWAPRNAGSVFQVSSSRLPALRETLHNEQAGLSQALFKFLLVPWSMSSCVQPLRVNSPFPPAPWDSQRQAPLTSKAECPRGSDPLFLGENLSVGHSPPSVGLDYIVCLHHHVSGHGSFFLSLVVEKTVRYLPSLWSIAIHSCVCVRVFTQSLWSIVVLGVCVHTCSVVSDSLWPQGLCPPGSSVHGTSQARILEWIATSFSRGSSSPGIQPTSLVSPPLAGRFFTTVPAGQQVVILVCLWGEVSSRVFLLCHLVI